MVDADSKRRGVVHRFDDVDRPSCGRQEPSQAREVPRHPLDVQNDTRATKDRVAFVAPPAVDLDDEPKASEPRTQCRQDATAPTAGRSHPGTDDDDLDVPWTFGWRQRTSVAGVIAERHDRRRDPGRREGRAAIEGRHDDPCSATAASRGHRQIVDTLLLDGSGLPPRAKLARHGHPFEGSGRASRGSQERCADAPVPTQPRPVPKFRAVAFEPRGNELPESRDPRRGRRRVEKPRVVARGSHGEYQSNPAWSRSSAATQGARRSTPPRVRWHRAATPCVDPHRDVPSRAERSPRPVPVRGQRSHVLSITRRNPRP